MCHQFYERYIDFAKQEPHHFLKKCNVKTIHLSFALKQKEQVTSWSAVECSTTELCRQMTTNGAIIKSQSQLRAIFKVKLIPILIFFLLELSS